MISSVHAPSPPTTVLITGAAGRVGRVLVRGLRDRYPHLRLVDLKRSSPIGGHVVSQCDLSVPEEALSVVKGADVVVHLAGIPDEAPFDDLMSANIAASYNVFEAARRSGVRRVVYASSHHVVGCYPRAQPITAADPVRPDSLYGVTKVFGEALGRLYHDKWGLEVACVRIGSLRPRPQERRQLSVWLSPKDAVRLFHRCIETPQIGFVIVFGVSRVQPSWWGPPENAVLGYNPQDSVQPFAEEVAGIETSDGPGIDLQGGFFADPQYRGGRG